jgi:hypothetical protein
MKYTLEAEFDPPIFRSSRSVLIYIENQYGNPSNLGQLKISAGKTGFFESRRISRDGHDAIHCLSSFYLDDLLCRIRNKLGIIEDLMDEEFSKGLFESKNIKLGFGDGPIEFERSFHNVYFLKYFQTNYPELRTRYNQIFQDNLHIVELYGQLRLLAKQLGSEFRAHNPELCDQIYSEYLGFANWQNDHRERVNRFNRADFVDGLEICRYQAQNKKNLKYNLTVEPGYYSRPQSTTIAQMQAIIAEIEATNWKI